jgi:hypothetical protein
MSLKINHSQISRDDKAWSTEHVQYFVINWTVNKVDFCVYLFLRFLQQLAGLIFVSTFTKYLV